jgi:DNA-binding CsgD family transcriptional regulator
MRGENALTTNQLGRALAVTRGLADLRDLSQFPYAAARLIRDLIPCDHSGYNAIDLGSGRATVVADPTEAVFEGGTDTLGNLAHQNPVIMRARQGDRAVLRLSDFISRSALHATELYNAVYRVSSLEYQLAVQLPRVRGGLAGHDELVGLSLARSRRDFSEAERALLALVVGNFSATLERLHELALLRALLGNETKESARWVVLLDPRDGAVAWASPAAAEALRVTPGGVLPAALRMWVRGEHARRRQIGAPLGAVPAADSVVLIEGCRLRASLIPGVYPELDALHLRAESAPDTQALCALGLTQRQAEVHSLALQGYTSQQIADLLFLSRRTVEKHFEAIYQRLGVSNRAQAVAGTLRALNAAT